MPEDFDIPRLSNDMKPAAKIIKGVKFCTEVLTLLKNRVNILLFQYLHLSTLLW